MFIMFRSVTISRMPRGHPAGQYARPYWAADGLLKTSAPLGRRYRLPFLSFMMTEAASTVKSCFGAHLPRRGLNSKRQTAMTNQTANSKLQRERKNAMRHGCGLGVAFCRLISHCRLLFAVFPGVAV